MQCRALHKPHRATDKFMSSATSVCFNLTVLKQILTNRKIKPDPQNPQPNQNTNLRKNPNMFHNPKSGMLSIQWRSLHNPTKQLANSCLQLWLRISI
jgi:hypothetical protein